MARENDQIQIQVIIEVAIHNGSDPRLGALQPQIARAVHIGSVRIAEVHAACSGLFTRLRGGNFSDRTAERQQVQIAIAVDIGQRIHPRQRVGPCHAFGRRLGKLALPFVQPDLISSRTSQPQVHVPIVVQIAAAQANDEVTDQLAGGELAGAVIQEHLCGSLLILSAQNQIQVAIALDVSYGQRGHAHVIGGLAPFPRRRCDLAKFRRKQYARTRGQRRLRKGQAIGPHRIRILARHAVDIADYIRTNGQFFLCQIAELRDELLRFIRPPFLHVQRAQQMKAGHESGIALHNLLQNRHSFADSVHIPQGFGIAVCHKRIVRIVRVDLGKALQSLIILAQECPQAPQAEPGRVVVFVDRHHFLKRRDGRIGHFLSRSKPFRGIIDSGHVQIGQAAIETRGCPTGLRFQNLIKGSRRLGILVFVQVGSAAIEFRQGRGPGRSPLLRKAHAGASPSKTRGQQHRCGYSKR